MRNADIPAACLALPVRKAVHSLLQSNASTNIWQQSIVEGPLCALCLCSALQCFVERVAAAPCRCQLRGAGKLTRTCWALATSQPSTSQALWEGRPKTPTCTPSSLSPCKSPASLAVAPLKKTQVTAELTVERPWMWTHQGRVSNPAMPGSLTLGFLM